MRPPWAACVDCQASKHWQVMGKQASLRGWARMDAGRKGKPQKIPAQMTAKVFPSENHLISQSLSFCKVEEKICFQLCQKTTLDSSYA